MAARMVTGACRCDRITPILAHLHWLPVSQRVVFKTVLMVWKCLQSVAPVYLGDLCILPRLVDRTCALHPVELYLFRACGLRWGSEVSPSVDRPPGTVCRLHYEHQSCHRTPLHMHWRHTCSRPPDTVDTFLRNSGAEYRCTDWRTDLFVS